MVLRQGLAALFATLLISFACAAAEAPSIGADPLPLAKPEDVGMSSERLAGIGAALREDIDRGLTPGGAIAIARRAADFGFGLGVAIKQTLASLG
jgi:hypothetical protein